MGVQKRKEASGLAKLGMNVSGHSEPADIQGHESKDRLVSMIVYSFKTTWVLSWRKSRVGINPLWFGEDEGKGTEGRL